MALPSSISEISRSDTRLIERAIKNQWPIPDEFREALIARQVSIATSDTSTDREATSAFRSLIAANAQNLGMNRRPKRRQPSQQTVVIVQGDLDETKRRAMAVIDQRSGDGSGGRAAVGGVDG